MTQRIFRPILSTIAFLFLLNGCQPAKNTLAFETDLRGRGFNVAILLVDTLRPDHLGCYGYDKAFTPHIDALAREGVLFENARSASTYTGEAVASLFTGRPPAMARDGLGWGARPTPVEENLPRVLESAGYQTAIFSTSFVMRFRGFYDSFQSATLFQDRPNTSELDLELTQEALNYAQTRPNDRLFQYLHYYAPHAPYNPPQAWLDRVGAAREPVDPADELHPADLASEGMTPDDPSLATLRAHYDAEIALIDDAIGAFMAGLRELGRDRNTIVVFVSDHGEEFLEHGFADHAWNLFDETLRVPLIVWAPALFGPGRVSDPVSSVDVMPTLLASLQIPHARFDHPASGQYLFRPGPTRWEYAPRTGPIYASLFPETRAQLHAVLFDGHKYLAGPRWLDGAGAGRFWRLQGALTQLTRRAGYQPLDPWAPVAREALFDLGADPCETRNLAAENTALRDRGRALLDAYRDAGAPYRREASPTTMQEPFHDALIEELLRGEGTPAPDEGQAPNEGGGHLSPEMIESLETMGYL